MFLKLTLILLTIIIKCNSISLNKRLNNIPKCCPIGLAYRRHPQSKDWYCGVDDETIKDDTYYKKIIQIQYQILSKKKDCKVKLVKNLNMNSRLQVTIDDKLRINREILVDDGYCLEKDGEQNILGVYTCDKVEIDGKLSNKIESSAKEVQHAMQTKNRVIFESSTEKIKAWVSKCCQYGYGLQKRSDNVWICQQQPSKTQPKDFLSFQNLEYKIHPTCMRRSKYYDINKGSIKNPLEFVRDNTFIKVLGDYCLDRTNGSDNVMIFYC